MSSELYGNNGALPKGIRVRQLPVSSRIKIYQGVMKLSKEGQSDSQIWRTLLKQGLQISYCTVCSWTSGVRDPRRKLALVMRTGGDSVELVGLEVGDGNWLRIMRGSSYASGRVSYASKDWDLAQRAGVLLGRVLGRQTSYKPYWSRANGVYVVVAGSKHLTEILSAGLPAIEFLITKYPTRFLKGIYNAEGCPNVKKKAKRVYPRVFMTNSDPQILALTRKLLANLGIVSTLELNTKAGKAKVILGKRTVTRANVYNICIGRLEMVRKFAKLIGFRVRSKQTLLQRVLRLISKYGTDGASLRLNLPSPR